MKRRDFLALAGTVLAAQGMTRKVPAAEDKRPHILWIMAEDICPDLSCYGVKGVQTPHLDKLASEGVLYQRAYTTSPVCSPSRSAMMTGMFQDYIGANQHRTNPKLPLPYGIQPITHLLEDAGYFTVLMNRKTDCNFTTEKPLFMGRDWGERRPGQPVFIQYTCPGTHRTWHRDPERPIDIRDVEIPPYYPDNDFVRRDWANGLETIQVMDREVGDLLKRLEDEGLADNLLVFFIGDNGQCHIRGKQFLYEGGLRVPMIARWSGKIAPGVVVEDPVMTIDISATILTVAGAKPSYELHGKNLFGSEVKKRKYVFAARDKMDDTHDSMRSVRSKDFSYILNLMPERPWCQYNQYKEQRYPVLALMNVMYMKGQLNPEQAAFMASSKPEEELYDLRNDPHELRNLAGDPAYAAVKAELRAALDKWRKDIKDQGPTEAFRKGGWPGKYPTRTLEEWEGIVEQWRGHLFEGKPEPKISMASGFAPET